MLMKLKGPFYLLLVICSDLSHLKTSGPNQTRSINLRNSSFHVEKNGRHKQTSSNQGAHIYDQTT